VTLTDTETVTGAITAVLSTRADRARLRGASRKLPVTTEFEVRILREGDRSVLHAAAVSPLVSTSLLEALFMTTSNPTLQRIIPRNPRAPLWVIGKGVHADFDEVALAFYAKRMGRPDLAYLLTEAVEDRHLTIEERWHQLGGGSPPADEPRVPCGH